MRIVFMGTPDFASTALAALYESGHEIAAVFTQPDKPRNRGMKETFSPVKELALSHGTPVHQPDSMRDGTAKKLLEQISPDLLAVVAYGKLLPPDILELPPYGCINIHGSLLPKYRGSAPIQHAVLNNEAETGVTAMFMSEEMDAGDIIAYKKTEIAPAETAGELFDRLAVLGGELLCETIEQIEKGTAVRTPQASELATYAPPLSKSSCPIDWDKSPGLVCAQIRGLNPWPVATAELGGTVFKIYSATPINGGANVMPGTVLHSDDRLEIACNGGSVIIDELQVPGKRRMLAADYLRGHKLCL